MAEHTTTRYEEIASYLRELVAELHPGDLLPSETELSKQFGVSRMTARHAVQTLERDHLVHRRKGIGTFVSPQPVPRLLGSPLSFTQSMRRRGMQASSDVLELGYITPSDEDAAALEISPDTRVGVIERLRSVDGVPMAIERAVLGPSSASVLEDLGKGSLHVAFEEIGLTPSRARARVTARAATDRERDLLELDENAVVLCERRVIFDQNGTPLEHTETRYAADRYVFDVVMYRDEGARRT
ncbi:MAG: GntR family transcriptional regulator [Acidimicrobiia bacterium]|nr:GntR family transcriptional regulator [Acidimicrobiia bacterium]